MPKLLKILPVKTDSEYRVSLATAPIDGLENIHDKRRDEFNRHIADVIPEGRKAAIFYSPDKRPKIVVGRHLSLA